VTDDDCLHSVTSVRADNLGACYEAKLTAAGPSGVKEAPPKPSRGSRVGRTQDDENALAAPQSADCGSARGADVASDDEIDGPDHCVCPARAGSSANVSAA
jgi:hypothetical protein